MDSLLTEAGVAGTAHTVPPGFIAPPGWAESVVLLDINDLHESPSNPRQHYDEADLAEFAEDIKANGVMQPLRVRERVPELFKGVPDSRVGYELIYGHRRLKAARLAGLAKLPCIVTDWTDLQVRRAQISENLSRKDVHPFEEAQGFADLIRDHGETADTIAASLGGPSKRSFVYGRLKMLQACPAVRKACIAGEIGSEVATMIARLRTDKLQEKALARIAAKYYDLGDGGKKSLRNIRELLAEEFTLDLTAALWDVADPNVLPVAGACTSCPKRSANAPEYEDLVQPRQGHYKSHTIKGNANLCTDPDCWAEKKKAHLKAEAGKLSAKGETVIDGNKARSAVGADGKVKGAYIALADVKKALDAASKGKPFPIKPQVVTIQNPRDGKTVKAVKVADLVSAGVMKAEEAKAKDADSWEERNRRATAQRKLDEQKAEELTKQYTDLLDRVLDVLATRERTAHDLYLVAAAAYKGTDWGEKDLIAERWGFKDRDDFEDRIGQMPVVDLNRLVMECAIINDVKVSSYSLNTKPELLLGMAKRLDVPLQRPAEPASTPSPAALAPAESHADADAEALAEDMAHDVAKAASTPRPAARAPAKVPPAKYRNPLTLETWSGRGLQPKWLKVAIEGGKKLSDFEVSQAASGRKDDKGAGSAGVSSSLTPAVAGGVAAKGETSEVAA